MLTIHHIGAPTSIPDWPQHGTVEGLLDAMERWPLDSRIDFSTSPQFEPHPSRKPFRGPAVYSGGSYFSANLGQTCYLMGKPTYPDSPGAVSYLGNFVGYSFAFYLDTDDQLLIAKLDHAIAQNLARQARGPGL